VPFICVQTGLYLIAILSRYHAMQFAVFNFIWLQNLILRFAQILQLLRFQTPLPSGTHWGRPSQTQLGPLILGPGSAYESRGKFGWHEPPIVSRGPTIYKS